MSTSTLLTSLFQTKAWANIELFAAVKSIDEATQQPERHAAIRLLNHIYVVDQIFAAHLQGAQHAFTATNTPETPPLDALEADVSSTDRWYVEYVASSSIQQILIRLKKPMILEF